MSNFKAVSLHQTRRMAANARGGSTYTETYQVTRPHSDDPNRPFKEKFYDFCHYAVVGSIVIATFGGFCMILFLLYQVNSQRMRNNKSTENAELLKRVIGSSTLMGKSITEMKEYFAGAVGTDGRIDTKTLLADPEVQKLEGYGVDMMAIFDWQRGDSVQLEQALYSLFLTGLFAAQGEAEDDNPTNRKKVGNVVLAMMREFQGGEPVVSNIAAFINACFNLGFLSDPNLGGMDYNEWILDYCQFMLGDETLQLDSVVEMPMFRILNRVPVYHLGLNQNPRKKKVYDSQAPQHGADKPGRPGYVPHADELEAKGK